MRRKLGAARGWPESVEEPPTTPTGWNFAKGIMEVLLLRDLLTDQILGLNGLDNLANFAFLVALSVRNVLKLRILSLVADLLVLPYYYFQHEPLWTPIFWGVAFIIVNGVQIVTLVLERRPVILSDKEDELYRVAFDSIDKRDFLKMVSLARWFDLSPGEVIVKKGHYMTEAIVLISGEPEAVRDGKTALAYRPGQLIGNVSTYSGLVSPMDVVVRSPARVATWDLEHMREFTESRPALRAKLLQIMSADLAANWMSASGHSANGRDAIVVACPAGVLTDQAVAGLAGQSRPRARGGDGPARSDRRYFGPVAAICLGGIQRLVGRGEGVVDRRGRR